MKSNLVDLEGLFNTSLELDNHATLANFMTPVVTTVVTMYGTQLLADERIVLLQVQHPSIFGQLL
jgi:hypothetical protein